MLERNAKEAVEKICQLFSALLHKEMTPSAQDDLKTRLKQAEKQHKTLQGEANLTDSGLQRSPSTDQLTLGETLMLHPHHCASQSISSRFLICCTFAVSAEKIAIVVSLGQEEIVDTDHVKTVSHSHIIESNSSVLMYNC